MKPVVFVTSKEFDPFTAMALNARFTCFLICFCKRVGLNIESSMELSRDIMRQAEISQDGDGLTTGVGNQ